MYNTGTDDFAEHVRRINEEKLEQSKLPYYEALGHPDKSTLHSTHLWWTFVAYLGNRALYLKTLRNIRQCRNMITPDLNLETCFRLKCQISILEGELATSKSLYLDKQKKLNGRRN